METFSALLAICAGNSPVSGEFPSQRPVTRSFDVFLRFLRSGPEQTPDKTIQTPVSWDAIALIMTSLQSLTAVGTIIPLSHNNATTVKVMGIWILWISKELLIQAQQTIEHQYPTHILLKKHDGPVWRNRYRGVHACTTELHVMVLC